MSSKLEEKFLEKIRTAGLPEPIREYQFHLPFGDEKKRKFRFDFVWFFEDEDKEQVLLAFEIEGGTYTGGRHTRGSGYAKDCEKYNLATDQNWKVYRWTGGMIDAAVAKLEWYSKNLRFIRPT